MQEIQGDPSNHRSVPAFGSAPHAEQVALAHLLERLLILCDRQEFHETVWKTIALDLLRFSGVSQMEARKTQACYVGRVGRIPAKLAKLSDDVFSVQSHPPVKSQQTQLVPKRTDPMPKQGSDGVLFSNWGMLWSVREFLARDEDSCAAG